MSVLCSSILDLTIRYCSFAANGYPSQAVASYDFRYLQRSPKLGCEVLFLVFSKGNGGDGGDAVDRMVRVACKALHLDLARCRHTSSLRQL